MRFAHWWMRLFTRTVALWQESGENPAVFCYLISWGMFVGLRSRQFAPIFLSARPEPACWNPSVISCTRSIVPRDSDN